MSFLDRHSVTIGRFAWVMAWFGLVAGQLHALARHATEDGKADLDLPATAFWSEPAADLFRPLLDWGDPDLVYVTYGKIWLPVFLAFTLCAFVVHRQRRPQGFEKWVWRVVLLGYVWAVLSVAMDYWTQWTGEYNALFDISFVLGLPAFLIIMIGSSVLGITLLRKGFRPLLPAWLLALTFPLVFVITSVTSMGSSALPIAFAFGLLGRRMAHTDPEPVAVPARSLVE